MLPLSANPILAATPAADAIALKQQHTMRRKLAKQEMRHQLDVANAAKELDELPGRDEALHCVMRGNFHGWDLVPAILRLAAKPIAELYVATLGFNRQNATELLHLLDAGQIGRVVFLCSKYFRESCPKEFEMLSSGLSERKQKLLATRTHAKILAARMTGGRCYVVESSANLRSCRNIEQFCMTESPALFRFHARWMEEVYSAAFGAERPAETPPAKKRGRK